MSSPRLHNTTERLGVAHRVRRVRQRRAKDASGPDGQFRRPGRKTQAQLARAAAVRIERLAGDEEHLFLESALLEVACADVALDPALAETRFAAMLSHPGLQVFVGFSGESPAATVTLNVIPNLTRSGASYALIENVVTATRYRKRGYAASLIEHAVETAWNAGCYKVMLLTGSAGGIQ